MKTGKIIFIIFIIFMSLFFIKSKCDYFSKDMIYITPKMESSIPHNFNHYNHFNKKQRIPKIIHQTFYKSDMDIEYYETCMINKNMNPEYKYMFYTDEDVNQFIEKEFPQYLSLYNTVIPGAYRADLFRYMILYKYGGVYIDCKSSTIVPLRDFINPEIGFVSFLDRPKSSIQIGFMASVPEHSLLKGCIEKAFENVRNKFYGKDQFEITGPILCGKVFNKLRNRQEEEDINMGIYKEIDVEMIGSFKTVGENKYEVMVDKDYKPLVSKSCGSHKNILRFLNGYGLMWKMGRVYKN